MNPGLLKSRIIYDYKPFIGFRMRKFYSSFIRQGDVCFDIGAHTGNRTSSWLKMGAKVIALEPQPALFEYLKKRFHGKADVEVLPLAIGKESGTACMHISSRHPTLSTLSNDWIATIAAFQPEVKFSQKVMVEVSTLDHLIEIYGIPSFCKIDVEGFEEEVLQGLSNALPALSFEFFPTTPARAIQCIRSLQKLGDYRFNWSFRESFRYHSREWMSANGMIDKVSAYSGMKSGDIYAIKS